LGIHEGENVETNTDSQPKKSLSRKRQLTKNEGVILKLCANDWNPFERADPKVLEKVRQKVRQKVMKESKPPKNYTYEDALL
jgi:hypothetical protein